MVAFWAILKTLLIKKKLCSVDNFTKIRATFYFNIWSHCTHATTDSWSSTVGHICKRAISAEANPYFVPRKFPLLSASVKREVNAAALVVLRPVDGAPRVAHVLVVADVEDPAADGQPEHDEDVLDELGLNFISNLNVFVKFCTLSRITHPTQSKIDQK